MRSGLHCSELQGTAEQAREERTDEGQGGAGFSALSVWQARQGALQPWQAAQIQYVSVFERKVVTW